jgi:dipeptidyl aminopeptidase/acylaminoacyl peptidase
MHALFAAVLSGLGVVSSADAGPTDPPVGRWACVQTQLTAMVLPGLPQGTRVESGPAPFGDLNLDGAGSYSLTSGRNTGGRYTIHRETGALTFTGLLAAFGNTYELSNGTAHLTFQNASISFSCSRPSAFRGSFIVSTPRLGDAGAATASRGPLNGDLRGKMLFTKPEGLFAVDVATGVTTFIRNADSFDRAENGEFVWVNRAGEMLVGGESGAVRTIQTFGSRSAPRFSRDGSRIVYMGETPSTSVDALMLSTFTSASRQPVVVDRDGKVLAAFGSRYIEPTWTPDGRVVMAGAKAAGSLAGDAPAGLFISDRALRSVQRIDPGMELPYSPAVSRDGTQLAFVSSGRVYVMGINGRNARMVAAGSTQYVGSVAWSPDGDAVAFRDNDQIFVAKLSGGVAPLKGQNGVGVYGKSNLAWIR